MKIIRNILFVMLAIVLYIPITFLLFFISPILILLEKKEG